MTVRFQDLNGEFHKYTAEGFEGRVIQHEVDHLNGTLYCDHVPAARLKPTDLFDGYLDSLQKELAARKEKGP